MRTQDLLLKIYIYDTTELIILSMLYTTSLVFIYLITGSLYLLTAFIQFLFPHPPRLVTTNLLSFSTSSFVFKV